MAGIGFELRRMLDKGTIGGVLEAYLYAGTVGSGPWLLSVAAILATGLIGSGTLAGRGITNQFQASVTYLMVVSLLLTSLLQLLFTRFIADCLYAKNADAVRANLLGALSLTMSVATCIGVALWAAWSDVSFIYAVLMIAALATLCGIWIVAIFASAIKAHRNILLAFAVGYGLTVALGWLLRPLGLEGLLAGFVAGQACLLFMLLAGVIRQYPGDIVLSYGFLRPGKVYPSLILTGFLYTAGTWCDKFLFWADPLTGVSVMGPLRASPLYDLPVFIGSLSMIPGMAAFLMTIETDFAAKCTAFFSAARDGSTLTAIRGAKADMIHSVYAGFFSILKVQAVTVAILLLLGPDLLEWMGISTLYYAPVAICIIASGLQVLLIATLSVFFYLDARRLVLGLCALFAACNLVFSWLTLGLGPAYFGYGLHAAVLITLAVGAGLLVVRLADIDYQTFMLQPVHF